MEHKTDTIMRHSLAHSAPTNPVTLTESHSQRAKICTSKKASFYQPHPTSSQVSIFNQLLNTKIKIQCHLSVRSFG